MKKILFALLLSGFFLLPPFLKKEEKKIVIKKEPPKTKKMTQSFVTPKSVPLYIPDTPFKKVQPLHFNHLKNKLHEMNQQKEKASTIPIEKSKPLRMDQGNLHISFSHGFDRGLLSKIK